MENNATKYLSQPEQEILELITSQCSIEQLGNNLKISDQSVIKHYKKVHNITNAHLMLSKRI